MVDLLLHNYRYDLISISTFLLLQKTGFFFFINKILLSNLIGSNDGLWFVRICMYSDYQKKGLIWKHNSDVQSIKIEGVVQVEEAVAVCGVGNRKERRKVGCRGREKRMVKEKGIWLQVSH